MKPLFGIMLVLFVLGLSSCRNRYEVPTYVHTDSYSTIFEGKRVPQDVR
ncbi:MAG: hypothetical protein J5787_03335 [Alphaproteobacteria bacterium]|nr:hypothetical protein [Alphaproteobacteria bacterium]MBO4643133.1 hypothetical protein [Alphaproteobacteria bacterium]